MSYTLAEQKIRDTARKYLKDAKKQPNYSIDNVVRHFIQSGWDLNIFIEERVDIIEFIYQNRKNATYNWQWTLFHICYEKILTAEQLERFNKPEYVITDKFSNEKVYTTNIGEFAYRMGANERRNIDWKLINQNPDKNWNYGEICNHLSLDDIKNSDNMKFLFSKISGDCLDRLVKRLGENASQLVKFRCLDVSYVIEHPEIPWDYAEMISKDIPTHDYILQKVLELPSQILLTLFEKRRIGWKFVMEHPEIQWDYYTQCKYSRVAEDIVIEHLLKVCPTAINGFCENNLIGWHQLTKFMDAPWDYNKICKTLHIFCEVREHLSIVPYSPITKEILKYNTCDTHPYYALCNGTPTDRIKVLDIIIKRYPDALYTLYSRILKEYDDNKKQKQENAKQEGSRLLQRYDADYIPADFFECHPDIEIPRRLLETCKYAPLWLARRPNQECDVWKIIKNFKLLKEQTGDSLPDELKNVAVNNTRSGFILISK